MYRLFAAVLSAALLVGATADAADYDLPQVTIAQQASQLCKAANKKIAAVSKSSRSAKRFYRKAYAIANQLFFSLSALKPAADVKALYAKFLSLRLKQLTALRRLRDAIDNGATFTKRFKQYRKVSREAGKLAKALGATACAT